MTLLPAYSAASNPVVNPFFREIKVPLILPIKSRRPLSHLQNPADQPFRLDNFQLIPETEQIAQGFIFRIERKCNGYPPLSVFCTNFKDPCEPAMPRMDELEEQIATLKAEIDRLRAAEGQGPLPMPERKAEPAPDGEEIIDEVGNG